MARTSTCLWFNNQAEQAVAFYVSLFPNSQVLHTTYYLDGTPSPAGSVLTVQFTLDGTEYLALNGGPAFTFSPAVSMVALSSCSIPSSPMSCRNRPTCVASHGRRCS